ncbi:MAG TPA: cation diffusion facilitator family transporter, partial [Polyangiaceae bacterium LLY-WYZ-15_(1-7)]|nr:cation diffusion facilitator family transporter [Polyangiaceae bacterium LLY-WYZ-15_(1-7)]
MDGVGLRGEDARDAGVRRVLLAALGLNLVVAAAKIGYGRVAAMLSIEADGYHSLTDGFASLVALGGLAIACRPPSATHPYGHRKYEAFAGVALGVSLLLLAAEVGSEAVVRLSDGRAVLPRVGGGAFAVLLGTLAINLGVARWQARAAERLGSTLLASDARHTRADCYVTAGVLLATALTWLGQPGLDVVAALVVAVLVGKAGVDVLRDNAAYLADVALVPPEQVRRVVEAVPPVVSAHAVRTRGTPSAVFMDLRLRLPPHLSLVAAGEAVARASEAIRSEWPQVVDVVVHPEPDVTPEASPAGAPPEG